MKKLFTLSLVMALIMSLMPNIKAQAQENAFTNFFVFEDGGVYDVTKGEFKATFTAPEDGILEVEYNSQSPADLYTDDTYTTPAEVQPEWDGRFGITSYTLAVEKGKTYYFYCSWCVMQGQIKVFFNSGDFHLTLRSSEPADGEEISALNTLYMVFNAQVKYSSATVSKADGTGVIDITPYVMSDGTSLYVTMRTPMMKLYREYGLKAGDGIKVCIEGLKELKNDARDAEGEKVEINLVAKSKPLELVAENGVPGGSPIDQKTFYSYFMKNGDEGVVTLTFDGDVDATKNLNAMIYYGTKEDGLYEEKHFPVEVIDGNKLNIDMRGNLIRPEYLINAEEENKVVGFRVGGIYSTDGQACLTKSESAVASFTYSFHYTTSEYKPVVEFDPFTRKKNPSSIIGVNEVTFCISDGGIQSHLYYDGGLFTYLVNGEEHTAEVDVTTDFEADGDDILRYITIPVPTFTADEGTIVKVSLRNMETFDGDDVHHETLTAYYAYGTYNGIREVNSGMTNDVYNMNGQKVKTPSKGIFLTNGKKYVK